MELSLTTPLLMHTRTWEAEYKEESPPGPLCLQPVDGCAHCLQPWGMTQPDPLWKPGPKRLISRGVGDSQTVDGPAIRIDGWKQFFGKPETRIERYEPSKNSEAPRALSKSRKYSKVS